MKRKVSIAYEELTGSKEVEIDFNIKKNPEKLLPIPLPTVKNINTPFEKLSLPTLEQHKDALKR